MILTMKFGGTSVGSPEAIQNVVGIITNSLERDQRVVSVVSAMSGVTDALIRSVKMAADGNRWGYLSLSQKLRDRHEEAVNRLTRPGSIREETLLSINKLFDSHIELCQAICIVGEVTPRIADAVVSFGERISSQIVAAALKQNGVNARAIDASRLIATDGTHQNASPLWKETESNIQHRLVPHIESGVTPVITGYIGSAPDGSYTTLGRGGSDYSAAIFAAMLHADEFTIWTDVDGVMTTDPRIDSRAQVLPYVSYQEVGELAYYGAKVVHPKTVQPIVKQKIPIRVRNTFNPDFPGTLIGAEMQPSSTVIKAVTNVSNISMLTVSGPGMLGVLGIAGRAFLATAQAGGNILMISQASSEQSFCFTVTDEKALRVKEAVEAELRQEIAAQNVDGVDVMEDVVIVTVVGAGMRGTPGVAGRVFTTLGNHGINVLAIAQGASEVSISFVVSASDLHEAVVRLHDLALETVNGM